MLVMLMFVACGAGTAVIGGKGATDDTATSGDSGTVGDEGGGSEGGGSEGGSSGGGSEGGGSSGGGSEGGGAGGGAGGGGGVLLERGVTNSGKRAAGGIADLNRLPEPRTSNGKHNPGAINISSEMQQVGMAMTEKLVKGRILMLDGSHLFPMEKPLATAAAIEATLLDMDA